MKYGTKYVEVEAVRWLGTNVDEVIAFVEKTGGAFNTNFEGGEQEVKGDHELWAEVYDYLQETFIPVNLGDWIIRGTEEENYPCANSVFERKYEPVKDDSLGGVVAGTDLIKSHNLICGNENISPEVAKDIREALQDRKFNQ